MTKILIVYDDKTNLKILDAILNETGYTILSVNNFNLFIETIKNEMPDIIILNKSILDINTIKFFNEINSIKNINKIPLIFVCEVADYKTITAGYDLGAVDYITKPFIAKEIKTKLAMHLKINELQNELKKLNNIMEHKVEEQFKQISDTQMETIFSLAKLAQSRDDDTGKHLERVQKYCYVLAKALSENSLYSNQIDENFIKNILNASPLHDIGKVGISDLILLKPGRLTHDEFEIMKTHTVIGYETLQEVDEKFGNNEFIAMGKVIARSHHERWDGAGYPDHLKGENIPLPARIMAIADVYDALSTKRIYKEALPLNVCVEVIKENRGTQFDPIIVDKFLEISYQFAEIHEQLKD